MKERFLVVFLLWLSVPVAFGQSFTTTTLANGVWWSGTDPTFGLTSSLAGSNSQTAHDAWVAALGGLGSITTLDYDSGPPPVAGTLMSGAPSSQVVGGHTHEFFRVDANQTGFVGGNGLADSDPLGISADRGFNVNDIALGFAGGHYAQAAPNAGSGGGLKVTFNSMDTIRSFGIYITGTQAGKNQTDLNILFDGGAVETVTVPQGDLGVGGLQFFGWTSSNPNKILNVKIEEVSGGNRDIWAIDGLQTSVAVPEPSAWISSLAFALMAVVSIRRFKARQA